jgi:DNA repair exonuclease SbcCD nuclease subunit
VNRTRFLHTADWQLGLRRHFLSEEALPRYRQARIDAIRTMAAAAHDCEFAVVAGDVFESNQIDATTLRRALEALAAFPCPVFLLPGNHDPFEAGSIHDRIRNHPRARVLVTSETVRPGLEVVGAPWHTKRPLDDLVAKACGGLEPAPQGVLRVLVAHGNGGAAGDHGDAALIDVDAAARAIAERKIHYVALGDRHSVTKLHDRIWYSGTPEPTAFRETDPGHALVVDLDEGECKVSRRVVGRWSFVKRKWLLAGRADVDALGLWLDEIPNKDCTVLKLRLKGTLGLAERAALDRALADAAAVFAGLERRDDLSIAPDEADLAALGLSGFARATLDELAARKGDEAAGDALALLYRLAGGRSPEAPPITLGGSR